MAHKQATALARAKINLSLTVTGRRDDGYHELVSLVTFANYGDRLEFVPDEDLSLEVSGPYAAQLAAAEDNLVMRAAHAYLQRFPGATSGHFILEKNIPVASGIGGGSADAAQTIQLLKNANPQHHANADDWKALSQLCLSLGADVPVCLTNRTCFMTGIGEQLHDAGATCAMPAVLVNPNAPVSTRDIFSALNIRRIPPESALPSPFPNTKSYLKFVAEASNDLQLPAQQKVPEIKTAIAMLERLDCCLAARMSGSGATVFGLFSTPEEARQAAQITTANNPEWWVQTATLGADQ